MKRLIHRLMMFINKVSGYSIWDRNNVPEINSRDDNLERFDLEDFV